MSYFINISVHRASLYHNYIYQKYFSGTFANPNSFNWYEDIYLLFRTIKCLFDTTILYYNLC